MTVFSTIKKSELEGGLRIDSEYYQPKYLELRGSLVKTKSYKPWRDLKGIFITGPFGSQFIVENYSEEKEYRYIRGRDVKDIFLAHDDNVYMPKEDYERLEKYSVQNHDILVSVVGTLGNSVVIDDSVPPAIFSSKSTVFRPEGLNSYYLVAYLNSKFGRGFLERSVRGAVQTGLNLDDLKDLPIFIPSSSEQERIASTVLDSKKASDLSETLYLKAEGILLKELGVKESDFEDELSDVVSLSDATERTDAEFFRPKYKRILTTLSKNKLIKLKDSFEVMKSKNFAYIEEGDVGVIKTKQLRRQYINFDVESRTDQEIIKKEKLPLVEDQDVLFASMGVGSLGKTNVFYEFETDKKLTIDSTLRIFRANAKKVIYPEVLAVYLSSRIGQELIYKYVIGTSGIISIYNHYLENFPVPVLPKAIQQEIGDLVQKSHAARQKSKQLLESAKHQVEQLIEKG